MSQQDNSNSTLQGPKYPHKHVYSRNVCCIPLYLYVANVLELQEQFALKYLKYKKDEQRGRCFDIMHSQKVQQKKSRQINRKGQEVTFEKQQFLTLLESYFQKDYLRVQDPHAGLSQAYFTPTASGIFRRYS